MLLENASDFKWTVHICGLWRLGYGRAAPNGALITISFLLASSSPSITTRNEQAFWGRL